MPEPTAQQLIDAFGDKGVRRFDTADVPSGVTDPRPTVSSPPSASQ